MSLTLGAPKGRPDILIIAGEHSGDEHAGKMLAQLKARRPELAIYALGGPDLKKAGAELLFDLTEHSVVGFVEVLKHYFFFHRLLNEVVRWVRVYKPRVLCLVDYPGFNLRLAADK